MRIIALKTLREYWEKEPDSKEALSAWHQEALAASWNGPADIKEKYRSASILRVAELYLISVEINTGWLSKSITNSKSYTLDLLELIKSTTV